MRKLLFLLLSGFSGPAASAQPVVPPLKKEFLDSAFVVLPSAAGARYRRETEYTDSIAAVVRVYFLDGRLQQTGSYSNLRKGIPDGVHETWFANGQLHFHAVFRQGRRDGELRTYYENGQLKRREMYSLADDFKSSGECFGPDGRPVPFYQYEQMPLYSEGDGGSRVIVRAIQRNLKFPREAIKAGVSGRVLVGFVVNNTGQVVNIKLVQGVHPAADEAVLDAVRQLKPFRPGMQDGNPVAVSFTVPVTFKIQ